MKKHGVSMAFYRFAAVVAVASAGAFLVWVAPAHAAFHRCKESCGAKDSNCRGFSCFVHKQHDVCDCIFLNDLCTCRAMTPPPEGSLGIL